MSIMSVTSKSTRSILNEVKQLIPPLSGDLHKGQAGRVGVVGGCLDYTGAPFFSAMSAMRLGADMSHNICEPSAGNVIKTYSPDCIVHGILKYGRDPKEIKQEIDGLCDRLHALVVGPGLGRDEHMQSCARISIESAKAKKLWLVIDADGLWLLQNEPGLIKGYRKAILTPNVVEFGRLCEKLSIKEEAGSDAAVVALAKALDGPTLMVKGKEDRITNGRDEMLRSDEPGGLKRAGGQGDVLSGTCATFLAWTQVTQEEGEGQIAQDLRPMLAAFGASTITRFCSREAFKQQGRALVAHDLIDHVGKAYSHYFGEPQAAL
jgi:ATP-dependent NAD(P)H-hydrate dehydratase